MIEPQPPNDERRRMQIRTGEWLVAAVVLVVLSLLDTSVSRAATHAWTMMSLSVVVVWLLLRLVMLQARCKRDGESPRLRFSLLQLLLFMTVASVYVAVIVYAPLLLIVVAAFILGGGGAMLAAKASGSPGRWWIRGILGAWIGLAVWLFLLPMHVGLSPNTRELSFVLGLSLVLACIMGPTAASVVRNRQGRHPQ
jgi:hypothetical protein